jgi:hypothetical protein
MKRALTTFGNPFGLALYDKEQHGVRGKARNHGKSNGQTVSWILLSAEGEVISLHEDPIDYCKALRQVIEASSGPERLKALWGRNAVTMEMLRANLRDLRTEAGEHYADILLSLYQRQTKELREEQEADRIEADAVQIAATAVGADVPADQAKAEGFDSTAEAGTLDRILGHKNGSKNPDEAISNVSGTGNSQGANGTAIAGQVDKSALPISAPRRVRDKDHLRFVASRPCLVCGRSPGHAHHIRFAQPRAMSRKVSDEWTVPLCATHHRAIHSVGDEEKWWKERQVDPIILAKQLWRERRNEASQQTGELTSPTLSPPIP